jgi:hypothetical protein
MRGCVYILHALTTPYYKIGRTTNIKNRVHGLRGTVPFFDLDVVAIHFHEKYEEIERRLHAMFTDKRLKNSEWFELSDDDLSTVLMRTVDLVDSMGFGNRKVDLHELFPSPQERAARLAEIEIVKTPVAKRKSNVAPEEPTDGMFFCSSRYKAVEQLSAEDARRMSYRFDAQKFGTDGSMLRAYADALDVYTGGYTYSIPLD